MSLVNKLLIKFLTEQISDEDAEAPVGSELGRIAFPQERGGKPFEENTKIEDKLHASIENFLADNIAIPANHCRLIQKFLANGWYTNVFAPPKVDIVYRVMSVNKKWLTTILNVREDEDLPEEGHIEVPYTYKSRRTCSSWTDNYDTATWIAYEFHEATKPEFQKDYEITMFAKISDNPQNTFITCLGGLYDVVGNLGMAEVISLIPLIKVFKIEWNSGPAVKRGAGQPTRKEHQIYLDGPGYVPNPEYVGNKSKK